MNNDNISWDDLPDYLSKEQVRKLCHISKETALYLLQSGKLPCLYSGKKTRCYKIKKEDVIAFLEDRYKYPGFFKAPENWYSTGRMPSERALPKIDAGEDFRDCYRFLLKDYPDVLNAAVISEITGYGKKTVNNWCKKGLLQHVTTGNRNLIPKIYLIDFFCSPAFSSITRKSKWHINVLLSHHNRKSSKAKRKKIK